MSFFQDLVIGVSASLIAALIGWAIKTWILKEPDSNLQQTDSAESYSQLIDYYVNQTQKSSRNNRTQRVEHRVTIEDRTKSSDDGAWVYIAILAFVLFVLGSVWQQYKILIFWIMVIVVVLGWASSLYFRGVLDKIPSPHSSRDRLLAYGSMVVWTIVIIVLYIGVFAPIYSDSTQLSSFSLSMTRGFQLLGVMMLCVSAILAIVLQLVAGSMYRKALENRLPYKVEIFIWGNFNFISIFIAFLLVFGTIFTSGASLQMI